MHSFLPTFLVASVAGEGQNILVDTANMAMASYDDFEGALTDANRDWTWDGEDRPDVNQASWQFLPHYYENRREWRMTRNYPQKNFLAMLFENDDDPTDIKRVLTFRGTATDNLRSMYQNIKAGWKFVAEKLDDTDFTWMKVQDLFLDRVHKFSKPRGIKHKLSNLRRPWAKLLHTDTTHVRIHTGFYKAFMTHRRWLDAKVENMKLREDEKLVITGHSQGGGVAYIAAIYLAAYYPELANKIQVIAYASALPGNAALSRMYNTVVGCANSMHIRAHRDPVSSLGMRGAMIPCSDRPHMYNYKEFSNEEVSTLAPELRNGAVWNPVSRHSAKLLRNLVEREYGDREIEDLSEV